MARAIFVALATVLLLSAPGWAAAQDNRIATSVEALIASARFFSGRTVAIRHPVETDGTVTRLAGTSRPVYVFWRGRRAASGDEIRGVFWDLGRLEQGDSRLTAHDVTGLLERVNQGRWPARDQIYVLLNAAAVPTVPPRRPTIRAIALSPDDYIDREVRVIGRFQGRNLYGELPNALGKDKWDFVLEAADGAIWVTGIRPRGKGFDLDPSRRVDTGKWLEVTGVVRQEGTTVYLDASKVELTTEQVENTVEVELPPPPPQPPPDIVFSAPVQDDVNVERTARVRIQFSRDMDPRSIPGRVRVSYAAPPAGGTVPPDPKFTVRYNDAAHAIEITFDQPLERFQQVQVELLEGILALDKQPLKPWKLVFSTGN